MKSDALQQLWQQQPAPTPLRDFERVANDARVAEQEWEREWTKTESVLFVCALLSAGPELLRLITTRHCDWFGLAQCAIFGWWSAAYIMLRRRRRQQERNYGDSLLDHITRGKKVLRDQLTFHWLSVTMLPVVAGMAGFTLWDATNGSLVLSSLGGGLTLLGLLVVWFVHGRTLRSRIATRQRRLDGMRADLVGSDS